MSLQCHASASRHFQTTLQANSAILRMPKNVPRGKAAVDTLTLLTRQPLRRSSRSRTFFVQGHDGDLMALGRQAFCDLQYPVVPGKVIEHNVSDPHFRGS